MRILLVEDDRKLNFSLKFQLEQEHYAVDSCYDGEEALYYMQETPYDLILLDRMLPHYDGLSVLRTMRSRSIWSPVIMLTALGQLQDKIDGLDCGADDYLVKPFDFEELNARIRSILRRPRQLVSSDCITFLDLSFVPDTLTLTGPAASCQLSRREGALLETFLRNPRQALARPSLLLRVWGHDSEVEDGNLDNYIYFLRRRLKAVSSAAAIVTVRGVGYRLEQQPDKKHPDRQ